MKSMLPQLHSCDPHGAQPFGGEGWRTKYRVEEKQNDQKKNGHAKVRGCRKISTVDKDAGDGGDVEDGHDRDPAQSENSKRFVHCAEFSTVLVSEISTRPTGCAVYSYIWSGRTPIDVRVPVSVRLQLPNGVDQRRRVSQSFLTRNTGSASRIPARAGAGYGRQKFRPTLRPWRWRWRSGSSRARPARSSESSGPESRGAPAAQ
jgi:hypothetical protein